MNPIFIVRQGSVLNRLGGSSKLQPPRRPFPPPCSLPGRPWRDQSCICFAGPWLDVDDLIRRGTHGVFDGRQDSFRFTYRRSLDSTEGPAIAGCIVITIASEIGSAGKFVRALLFIKMFISIVGKRPTRRLFQKTRSPGEMSWLADTSGCCFLRVFALSISHGEDDSQVIHAFVPSTRPSIRVSRAPTPAANYAPSLECRPLFLLLHVKVLSLGCASN